MIESIKGDRITIYYYVHGLFGDYNLVVQQIFNNLQNFDSTVPFLVIIDTVPINHMQTERNK